MEKPFHTPTSELKGTGKSLQALYFLLKDLLCFHPSVNELKKEFPFFQLMKQQSFSHVKLNLSRHLSLGRHEAEHFSLKPNKSIKKIYSSRDVFLQILKCELLVYFLAKVKDLFASFFKDLH